MDVWNNGRTLPLVPVLRLQSDLSSDWTFKSERCRQTISDMVCSNLNETWANNASHCRFSLLFPFGARLTGEIVAAQMCVAVFNELADSICIHFIVSTWSNKTAAHFTVGSWTAFGTALYTHTPSEGGLTNAVQRLRNIYFGRIWLWFGYRGVPYTFISASTAFFVAFVNPTSAVFMSSEAENVSLQNRQLQIASLNNLSKSSGIHNQLLLKCLLLLFNSPLNAYTMRREA